VRASVPFEPDPGRIEVYDAVARTRERLLSLGFVERRAECDLWRPAGLREVESLLFREPTGSGSTRPASISSVAGLAIRGAPQGDGSARMLAREVRQIMDRGVQAEDVLVLFRQWSPQAELALETLRAWGIPAWSRTSGPLDGDSAVAALLLAMRVPAEDWETDLLVRLLRHGQVRPTERGADPAALVAAASAIQAARVFRGGPDLILKALGRLASDPKVKQPLRQRAGSASAIVPWILGVLERAARPRGWFGQVEQLLDLSDSLGLGRLPRARRALDQMRDVLEERGDLAARLRRGKPERPISWAEFSREVGRIIAETPLDGPAAPATGCVRLATVDDARGACAKFILLADLAEGSFPAREAVEPFLAVAPGQVPDAAARLAYSREALRFLGVLGSAEHGATLLYPTTDAKGQELLRAGFLDELLGLLTPDAARLCHESHSRFDPALVDYPDLAAAPADRRVRAIARARELGDATALAGIPVTSDETAAMDGVAAALTAARSRAYRSPFGEFDGMLRDGAAIVDVGDRFNREFLFSPSQLETYIGCPFQFFAKYVMKLDVRDDRDELGEDFTERGSRIHDLLERLEGYRRSLAGTRELQNVEKIALDGVKKIELADPTGVDRGLRMIEDLRLERVLNRYRVQLKDYEANSPSKPVPLAFEVKFGQEADEEFEEIAYPPLQIGPEHCGIKLQGMIDRIDIVETPQGPTFRVIDYKSGAGPSATDVKTGHMLQLPLYALAVERHILADRRNALLDVGYWGLKKGGYRSIRFDRWATDQEVLESYVVEVVRKLRDGVFPVASRQPGCEGFCEFRTICRVRQVRSARKESGDAIVPAIALAASTVRIKGKASAGTAEVPGVVRAEPLGPEPVERDE
jgi:RecB family exonuclease